MGIPLLLLLIIKFKIHPVLSLLIAALFIGLGAGMPVSLLVSTIEKGAGETLQGIVLLIGLGSLFGGINGEQLKKILDRSLRPTGQILLVITGGGIICWVLQDCGMGNIIGPVLERSGMHLILVAFLIVALIRASVGAAVVAMTMVAGIMASMPAVAALSPVYLAAMVCAITGGATAFSHVNDSGFWLVNSLLEIDEKTTLKSWTIMEIIVGINGLVCAVIISFFV